MRIKEVVAHAFGAFKGRRLHPHRELTLVVGRNGSGKSTWHAAIYAALCGHPNSTDKLPPGRPRHRYEPRDGREWLVSCDLTFDDGRKMSVLQDLRRANTSDVMPRIGLDSDTYALTTWLSGDTPQPFTDGQHSLLPMIRDHVRLHETELALDWLQRAQWHLGRPDGPLERARLRHERARLQNDLRAGAQRKLDDARLALNEAIAREERLDRQCRLARAYSDHQKTIWLREEVDRLTRPDLSTAPMPGFVRAWQSPSHVADFEVHGTVQAAEAELDRAEAAFKTLTADVGAVAPDTALLIGLVLAIVLGVVGTPLSSTGRVIAWALAAVLGLGAIAQWLIRRSRGAASTIAPPPVSVDPAPSKPSGPLPQEREPVARRVELAANALMAALDNRGMRARGDERPRDLLARYRLECAERAAAAGDKRALLAQRQAELEDAMQRDADWEQEFARYEINAAYGYNADDVCSTWEQSKDAIAPAQTAADEKYALLDDFPPADSLHAELVASQTTRDRLELLEKTFWRAQEMLRPVQHTAIKNVAVKLEESVSKSIGDVMGKQRFALDIDQSLDVHLIETGPDGQYEGDPSGSTQHMLNIFFRIALGDVLGGKDQERGPLVLDDVTTGADPSRLGYFLDALHRMAQRRQVIFFTPNAEFAENWARIQRELGREVMVKRLPDVASDPDPAEH